MFNHYRIRSILLLLLLVHAGQQCRSLTPTPQTQIADDAFLTKCTKQNGLTFTAEESQKFTPDEQGSEPTFCYAHYWLISQQPEKALQLLVRLTALKSPDDRTLLKFYDKLYQENRLDVAELLLKGMIQNRRAQKESYRRMAISKFSRGEYKESLDYLDEILALDPIDSDALFLTGLIYFRHNNFEKTSYYLNKIHTRELILINDAALTLATALFYQDEIEAALKVTNLVNSNSDQYSSDLIELKGRLLLTINWQSDLSRLQSGDGAKKSAANCLFSNSPVANSASAQPDGSAEPTENNPSVAYSSARDNCWFNRATSAERRAARREFARFY